MLYWCIFVRHSELRKNGGATYDSQVRQNHRSSQGRDHRSSVVRYIRLTRCTWTHPLCIHVPRLLRIHEQTTNWGWLSCGFTSHSTQNGSFRRHFPKPISWPGMEKLNRTQQKHTFTNRKKCKTTQNEHKKLKPRLVAFYDIQPEIGTDLFSKEKISKGGDKWGKSEEKR